MIEDIAKRRDRIAATLDQHQVPYALIGGLAVAAWVAGVDPDAVRTTKDVDILLNEDDLPRARAAAEAAGFEYAQVMNVPMFLDRDDPRPKRAVHIIWAGKIVRSGDSVPSPTLDDAVVLESGLSVISLDALVRMKLTAYHLHDQVHLKDMQQVGLIDASWCAKLPAVLAERLQRIIDLPEA